MRYPQLNVNWFSLVRFRRKIFGWGKETWFELKKKINKYILPQGTVDLVYTKPESIPDVASA